MDAAHQAGIVPVISPLAAELATGKPLNINADLAAAALAKELRVAKLVYLSDVPGLLSDPKDPASLIKSVTRAEADAMIADGTISGGMIPKIRSAVDASTPACARSTSSMAACRTPCCWKFSPTAASAPRWCGAESFTAPQQRVVVRPHDFGSSRAGLDFDRMNQLVDELEVEHYLQKEAKDDFAGR
jgi:hypothetical protein